MLINNNTVKASELSVQAKGIVSPKVILRNVRISYQKDTDGKRTDVIEAVRYDVIDPTTYSTFCVKVIGSNPVVTPEELEKSDDPISIEIPVEKVVIKPYKIEYGIATLSIVAPFVNRA